jgi:hypothetical protein
MGLPAQQKREALPIATATGDAVAGYEPRVTAGATAYEDARLDDPAADPSVRRDKEEWRNQPDGFFE